MTQDALSTETCTCYLQNVKNIPCKVLGCTAYFDQPTHLRISCIRVC